MIIKDVVKEWLIAHEHYEDDPTFSSDLEDLCELLISVANSANNGAIGIEEYDPSIADDTLCLCGHTYYRHFDTYDNMSPVGCKYCLSSYDGTFIDGACPGFKKK